MDSAFCQKVEAEIRARLESARRDLAQCDESIAAAQKAFDEAQRMETSTSDALERHQKAAMDFEQLRQTNPGLWDYMQACVPGLCGHSTTRYLPPPSN